MKTVIVEIANADVERRTIKGKNGDFAVYSQKAQVRVNGSNEYVAICRLDVPGPAEALPVGSYALDVSKCLGANQYGDLELNKRSIFKALERVESKPASAPAAARASA